MMICCVAASCLDKFPRIVELKPDTTFDSHWLNLKRSTVRYVRRGNQESKETVVLIPDPPNTIEHMEVLIKILEQSYQVVAFEGPGFGYSTASLSYDFSLAHGSEVIIEVLEKLQIERAILALTCISALHGLMAAKKRPDIISSLVLGQIPSLDEAKMWAKRVDYKGYIGTPFVGQALLRLMRNKISDVWYKNALPKGTDRQSYIEKTIDSYKNGARFSLASAFQALERDKTIASELVVGQNAFVLWGASDRSHKKTNKNSVLDMLPNGRVVEIKDCGHFPDIEAPDEYAKAIYKISDFNS